LGNWQTPCGYISTATGGTLQATETYGHVGNSLDVPTQNGQMLGVVLAACVAPSPTAMTGQFGEFHITGAVIDVAVGEVPDDHASVLSFGLYVATYDPITMTYDLRSPAFGLEAQGDDWIHLRSVCVSVQTYGTTPKTVPGVVSIPLSIPLNLRLKSNEALIFALGDSSIGSSTLSMGVRVNARTRIRRVA